MFRVLSDLHLEFYSDRRDGVKALLDTIPWTDADKDTNLLLAGDVGWCVRPARIPFSESARALLGGNVFALETLATAPTAPMMRVEDGLPQFVSKSFVRLLAALRARFRSVTYVPGNHEYYVCTNAKGKRIISPTQVDCVLRAICRRTDVTFLQKEETRIDGVRVLGCTLWAPYHHWDAGQTNDTNYVSSLGSIQAAHKDHADWLMAALCAGGVDNKDDSSSSSSNTLVMTHHPPIRGTNSCYYADFLRRLQKRTTLSTANEQAEGEEEDELEQDDDALPVCLKRYVHTWVCGHDHANVEDDTYGTYVCSCCHGYPEELRERAEPPTPKVFSVTTRHCRRSTCTK